MNDRPRRAVRGAGSRDLRIRLEASRRIGDHWKVEPEARLWNGVGRDDPMFPLHRDDYVRFTVSRLF